MAEVLVLKSTAFNDHNSLTFMCLQCICIIYPYLIHMYLLMFISGKFQGLRGFQVYKYRHSIIFARSMGGGVVGGGSENCIPKKYIFEKCEI